MLTATRASPSATTTAVKHHDEGIDHIDLDHLFLLPVRVLSMDSASLRKDLAGLDFNVHLLHNGPQGNVWLCECRDRVWGRRRSPTLTADGGLLTPSHSWAALAAGLWGPDRCAQAVRPAAQLRRSCRAGDAPVPAPPPPLAPPLGSATLLCPDTPRRRHGLSPPRLC
ncbi:hypothetical protein ONE63_000310 [Megalurothrips usitatus]|uniref:Uncharacterized protein n=1 Tax=Megalurothrips usitatus TaxID=439358 RepID=A0AAV7Y2Y8_9NEOP|nr:hypothetical protein ONE63_000310 [Megalurothrips usitatus]